MHMKRKVKVKVISDSLWPHGLYKPWNSPGQNTGVGSLSLLQGDLPNPGIEPRSLPLQADSLPAEPQGKSRILEWVAYPFSSRSSWSRNQTGVSCIAGRFFTNSAIMVQRDKYIFVLATISFLSLVSPVMVPSPLILSWDYECFIFLFQNIVSGDNEGRIIR